MHSTCPDHTTRAARRYVSPRTRPLTREEAEIRALAYALKDPRCDTDLVKAAAREMAALIADEEGYLIPVPDHNGNTEANNILAAWIATETSYAFERVDALTRTAPTESACERHKKRLPTLSVQSHNIAMRTPRDRLPVKLYPGARIYFVDNVLTSGNTIEACRQAFLGLGTGLVYADAHNDEPN